MKIHNLDDIEREKNKENRERIKSEISEDINDVLGNVFGKQKKEKFSIVGWILRVLIFAILGLIIIDIILGSVWIFKFLVKDLFFK
jgi:Fe2+ transport system protein B